MKKLRDFLALGRSVDVPLVDVPRKTTYFKYKKNEWFRDSPRKEVATLTNADFKKVGIPAPPPGTVGRTIIQLGPDVRAITKDHDAQSSLTGICRPGTIKLEGVKGDLLDKMILDNKASWSKLDSRDFVLIVGNQLFSFEAVITEMRPGGAGVNVTLQPISEVKEITEYKWGEWATTKYKWGEWATTKPVKERKPMPTKMQQGLKRFYVGSNNLTADWTHEHLAGAVEHARKLVTKDGYEEVFVVEIKRVVRRKEQPVVVEPFK